MGDSFYDAVLAWTAGEDGMFDFTKPPEIRPPRKIRAMSEFSPEEKKQYLDGCQKRRDIIAEIAKLKERLAALSEKKDDHIKAAELLHKEIKDIFHHEFIELLDYKDLRLLYLDTKNLETKSNTEEKEVKTKLAELSKQLEQANSWLKDVKKHLKGKGRVLNFERSRS